MVQPFRRISNQQQGASNVSSSKDVCIWVVPPFGCRIRKIRMRVASLCIVSLGMFVTLAGVSFMAGDYVRLQLQNARSFLFVASLANERNLLKNSNQSLYGELKNLKDSQDEMISYHKTVKERLQELNSVVASIQAMGVEAPIGHAHQMAQPKLKGKEPARRSGIGGAEIECKGGDLRCAGLLLDDDGAEEPSFMSSIGSALLSPINYVARKGREFFIGVDDLERNDRLLAELDDYITTIRVLPFGLPSTAEITSEFGYRRSPFSNKFVLHEGMDFSPPAGTEVVSTGDGLVKDVKYNQTYGLVVDIEHTPQVTTRYAHLRKATVSPGDKISRGTVIGSVGSTGRSTGPHLHYEVRINGEPKNPEDMIALGERLTAVF